MSPTRHPKTTEARQRQAGDGVARGAAAACARALKQVAGFTLTEALTTVVIVGLVTTILAGGIGLATKQYTQQMSNSEAQMLYSSLQKILDTELRFVDEFKYDKTSGKVTSFESKHYMAQQSISNPGTMEPTIYLCTIARMPGDVMVAQEPATPGQLAMASDYGLDKAYNPLLPSAAYNYGLQASVKTFTYNSTGNYFTLNLTISHPDGETVDGQILVDETFTVRPLNYSQTSSGGSGSGSGEGSGGNGQGGGSGGGATSTIERIDDIPVKAKPLPEKPGSGTEADFGDQIILQQGDVVLYKGDLYVVIDKKIVINNFNNFKPPTSSNSSYIIVPRGTPALTPDQIELKKTEEWGNQIPKGVVKKEPSSESLFIYAGNKEGWVKIEGVLWS